MVTKKDLINQFQKDYGKYWKVELFDRKGFVRKKCGCGKFFWTLDSERKTCPDPPCQNYEFLGNPPTKKRFGYIESWKQIENFFVKNSHTSVKRYPVVCRWRPDLFFNIASIIDFQRVENGKVIFELPSNPLIVPQMCLRFPDIPSVGVSGRHYTSFAMVGQHAVANEEGYWKDRCIDLDFGLLTSVFGIPEQEIIFLEDAWLGYGAFGSSLEYFVRGVELGNAVFTEFLGTPDSFKQMKEKIIDMGAGLERFPWVTQGNPTSYDVVFEPVLKVLKKEIGIEYDEEFFLKYARLAGALNFSEVEDIEGVRRQIANQLRVSVTELKQRVEPLEALYALCDHTKALTFAISDGSLPSNVSGGYNLRVILRRALNFIDKFGWNLDLAKICELHAKQLKPVFPELTEHMEDTREILEVEKKKYKESRERAKKIVDDMARKEEKVDEKKLIELYDSHGITPELLTEAGLKIEIPPDFYVKVTERHMQPKVVEERPKIDVEGLPKTRLLFYEKPSLSEFSAKVLSVSGDFVVLDQTAFYGRSGGQEPDSGRIEGCDVLDVQKVGDVIIHQLKGCGLRPGQTVNCQINMKRRLDITRHHTATHIINAAAREMLGSWVWQHSAFKDVDSGRLDITHFEALTDEETERIEAAANKTVEEDLPIEVEILPRSVAEERYGFRIYQGGAIPEKTLRIVSIGDRDVEACGGTHELLKSSKEVGRILVLRTKRIQDGAVRIEFAAGDVAMSYLKEKGRILKEVADVLKVGETEVPAAIEELFETWKKKRKELKKLRKK